jgi:hypothetical protein
MFSSNSYHILASDSFRAIGSQRSDRSAAWVCMGRDLTPLMGKPCDHLPIRYPWATQRIQDRLKPP